MKKLLLSLLFLPTLCHAGNLISSATWSESGDFKMAQQDQYPFGVSSNTISRIWDGTTIKLFGGKGELLTWATYLNASSAGNANNVMVKISSFTGTGTAAGSGFAAVAVSSTNVWDYSTRPYSLYKYGYVQMVGLTQLNAGRDPSEYDEQQFSPRWSLPCTLNGNNDCVANNGTNFLSRLDNSKFYPDPAIPIELFSISSFTVAASSSQAIGGEVYVSTNMLAGTYTATLTVYEGASVSTTIPINLLVYNVTLPASPSLPVFGYMGQSDITLRLDGNEFPSSDFVDPYKTSLIRVGAFLHRHRITAVGDLPASTADYPSAIYSPFLDGSGFREAYGQSPNTSPGYGTPEKNYVINTYGGNLGSVNWSTSVVTSGGNGYCDNVSSWTAYCTNAGITCYQYTGHDEASGVLLNTDVNKWSEWNATAPACASGGHTLPYTQTGTLPTVIASAPYVSAIWSTSWLTYSSATWITDEALSSYTVAGYNSGLGVASLYAMDADGYEPREYAWGAWKTNQKSWFLWDVNYAIDSNNGGQPQNGWNANSAGQDNLYALAKNEGYDNYPTTDAVKGHTGFQFSMGDGNVIYYGTDTVYSTQYGVNGYFPSWRLNQVTRGSEDYDIIKLAYAVNASSTTNLVNQQVQDVMYLRQCFTLADCSYTYGPRPFNTSINSWELTREALLQTAQVQSTSVSPSVTMNGNIKFSGKVTIQ